MAKPKPRKDSEGKTSSIFKSLERWIISILIGGIITTIGFWWQINLGVSITSQTPINPNDTFSTYFTFSNTTNFVLSNIVFKFTLNATDRNGNTFNNFQDTVYLVGQLKQQHSDTENTSISDASPITKGDLIIDIHYIPKFWFIHLPSKNDTFHFMAVPTTNGTIWIEKDVE